MSSDEKTMVALTKVASMTRRVPSFLKQRSILEVKLESLSMIFLRSCTTYT